MSYAQIDRNNPNFYLFPVNSNRTAWKPISLPIILIAPHTYDFDGVPLENGAVLNVRVYIENVEQNAFVAGQDHILTDGTQQRYPARELYSVTLTTQNLLYAFIKPGTQTFIDAQGNPVPVNENGLPITVTDNLFFTYTTGSGIHSTVPYFPTAAYYDFSDIEIETENLPSSYYNLVYEVTYNARVTSNNNGVDDFLCLSTQIIKSSFRFGFDHPGHAIHEMYRYTPTPYLTNSNKSSDSTVEFYRPFSEIINDVYDEQKLLESINWVNKAPLEMVPYLAYLLGWELPYFPQTQGAKSLDAIRRAVIKNTVYFQQLKGSRKAIKEIFSLFGLEILVENLWWSTDGKILIRPNQSLPAEYLDQAITAEEVSQTDALTIATGFNPSQSEEKIYDASKNLLGAFYKSTANLLFVPQEIGRINLDTTTIDLDNVTIEAALFDGSDGTFNAYQAFQADYQKLVDNPTDHTLDENLMAGAIARTTLIVGGSNGQILSRTDVNRPVLANYAFFDKRKNQVTISSANVVESNQFLFAWVKYKRINVIVPSALKELPSNRFDIQVLTKDLQGQTDPKTLNFSLDFLFKLKAFHSLLYVIRNSINNIENYEVTDLKVGGNNIQRYDNTDLGRLQVPPAILPNPSAVSCGTPEEIGFKRADINLRLQKINALKEETAVSYNLEGYICIFSEKTRPALSKKVVYHVKTYDEALTNLYSDFDVETIYSITDRSDTHPINTISRIAPNQKNLADSNIYSNRLSAYGDYSQNIIEADNRLETISEIISPSPNANSQSNSSTLTEDITDLAIISNSTPVTLIANKSLKDVGYFTLETRGTSPSPAYPLVGTTDYAYKGRVNDGILYRSLNDNAENYQNVGGVLTMGLGCYYAFPTITTSVSPNAMYSGSAPAEGIIYYHQYPTDRLYNSSSNSLFSRKFKSLKNPGIETIHFADGVSTVKKNQQENQAFQKPDLGIQKTDLSMPGTRFPSMCKLKDTFTSAYKARPWDDYRSCGTTIGGCAHEYNYLNAKVIIGEDGDQRLAFDSQMFTVIGNNLDPDIVDLGYNQANGETNTVHSIYNAHLDSPYVTLDCLVRYSDTFTVQNYANPIFKTANQAKDDIKDGYPASTGVFSYLSDVTYDYADALAGIGLPVENGTGVSLFYTLGSTITDGSPAFRLDGGSIVTSGGAYTASLSKSMSYFLDGSEYDYSPDKVNMLVKMDMVEEIGAGVLLLDGQLDNLVSIL